MSKVFDHNPGRGRSSVGNVRPAIRRGHREAKGGIRRGRIPLAKGMEETLAGQGFHQRALARAWRQFQGGSLSHWVTTSVIALSLTIYGTFALLLTNANTALEQWEGDHLITVFMERTASATQLAAVQEMITNVPGITGLKVITPAEAMGRLKVMLGSEAGLLDDLEENPLPSSIEFQLLRGKAESSRVLAHELGGWPGIEAVSYDYQWADRLAAVVKVVRYAGMVISFLLLSAVAMIISNTIKLTIIARRDEVEVMRFMGATDAFIKIPFIYEGILQGLLGALGALVFTSLLYFGAQEVVLDLGRVFGVHLPLHFLPFLQLMVILTFGVVLGLAGALLSLSRFLEM